MLMINTEIILATITIVISSIFSSDNTFITSLRLYCYTTLIVSHFTDQLFCLMRCRPRQTLQFWSRFPLFFSGPAELHLSYCDKQSETHNLYKYTCINKNSFEQNILLPVCFIQNYNLMSSFWQGNFLLCKHFNFVPNNIYTSVNRA